MSQPIDRASNQKQADEIRQNVRESYSQVAEASNNSSCCGTESSCCGVSDDAAINALVSTRLGYSEDDLDTVPEGADMGLGCGNPRAIASIKTGKKSPTAVRASGPSPETQITSANWYIV